MIEYDTEAWLWRTTCRLKGSVLPHSLVVAIPSALLGAVLVWLRETSPSFEAHSEAPVFSGTAWSVLAFPLSILIAFRTRQALGRFWEGTGLLHAMRGEWFDSASLLATFTLPAKDERPDEVRDFRHTLIRLFSLCHGAALEEIKAAEREGYEVLDLWGLSEETMDILRDCKSLSFNRVEVILHMIQVLIIDGQQRQIIDVPAPILSRVYQTLSRGFVNLLNARKIKDTRFPFPYAQLIGIFLLIFAVQTPWALSTIIQSKLWCAIFTFLPVCALFALNYTAGQLEMPFGDDDNDLPLDNFQREMNTSLLMFMHESSDHVPRLRSTCRRTFFSVQDMVDKVDVRPVTSTATWISSLPTRGRGSASPHAGPRKLQSMFDRGSSTRGGSVACKQTTASSFSSAELKCCSVSVKQQDTSGGGKLQDARPEQPDAQRSQGTLQQSMQRLQQQQQQDAQLQQAVLQHVQFQGLLRAEPELQQSQMQPQPQPPPPPPQQQQQQPMQQQMLVQHLQQQPQLQPQPQMQAQQQPPLQPQLQPELQPLPQLPPQLQQPQPHQLLAALQAQSLLQRQLLQQEQQQQRHSLQQQLCEGWEEGRVGASMACSAHALQEQQHQQRHHHQKGTLGPAQRLARVEYEQALAQPPSRASTAAAASSASSSRPEPVRAVAPAAAMALGPLPQARQQISVDDAALPGGSSRLEQQCAWSPARSSAWTRGSVRNGRQRAGSTESPDGTVYEVDAAEWT